MTRAVALLALALATVACSRSRSAVDPELGAPPGSTSIYGTWILRDPDSTAFAGAELVELTLDSAGTFALAAHYPAQPAVVIRGTIARGTDGTLTFTPGTGSGAAQSRLPALVPGQPLTLLASAARNTLVFAPPTGSIALTPSSVWYRKQAAAAAGMIGDAGSRP